MSPRPTTGAKPVAIRWTPEELARLDAAAEDTGQTRTDYVKAATEHALAGCGVPSVPSLTRGFEVAPLHDLGDCLAEVSHADPMELTGAGDLTDLEAGILDAALRMMRRHEERNLASILERFGDRVDQGAMDAKRAKLALIRELLRRIR